MCFCEESVVYLSSSDVCRAVRPIEGGFNSGGVCRFHTQRAWGATRQWGKVDSLSANVFLWQVAESSSTFSEKHIDVDGIKNVTFFWWIQNQRLLFLIISKHVWQDELCVCLRGGLASTLYFPGNFLFLVYSSLNHLLIISCFQLSQKVTAEIMFNFKYI